MDVIDKNWNFFKYKYLCSKHFQKCMYSKNNNLKRSAVPTLYLSEKPIKHDSSTQTEESIEYVRSDFQLNVDVKEKTQNAASLLYVMPNVEKSSTYTQIEDISYDTNNVNVKEETTNIKEETITDLKIEESEMVEQDVEIKTESDDDDESSDSKAFEDIDMKIDIVENPILPAQFTQITDLKIMKESQENDQNKRATIVNAVKSPVSSNSINTNSLPIMPINDKSVQTKRVIVLSQNPETGEESINPKDCKCKRSTYDDMTPAQFFRLCSRFLSPDFSILVKTQMYLDNVMKENEADQGGVNSNNSAGLAMNKCEPILDPYFEHQGVITPEVGVAITQMYLDGVTKQVGNDLTEAGSSGSVKCAKCRKVVSPEMFVIDKQMYLDGDRKLIRNDLIEAGSSGSEELGIAKSFKETAGECRKEVAPEMDVAGKQTDLAGVSKPVENDGASSIGSLAKCDEESAAKCPRVSAPTIVVPCTRIAVDAEDDLFDM